VCIYVKSQRKVTRQNLSKFLGEASVCVCVCVCVVWPVAEHLMDWQEPMGNQFTTPSSSSARSLITAAQVCVCVCV